MKKTENMVAAFMVIPSSGGHGLRALLSQPSRLAPPRLRGT
jgi:hypothetical protein